MTLEEFLSAVAPEKPAAPILYRLYYGKKGEPLFFSQEDLPGNYVNLDRETFVSSPINIRVVDGELITVNTAILTKLAPDDDNPDSIPCHPRDVCVVVDESQPHKKWIVK